MLDGTVPVQPPSNKEAQVSTAEAQVSCDKLSTLEGYLVTQDMCGSSGGDNFLVTRYNLNTGQCKEAYLNEIHSCMAFAQVPSGRCDFYNQEMWISDVSTDAPTNGPTDSSSTTPISVFELIYSHSFDMASDCRSLRCLDSDGLLDYQAKCRAKLTCNLVISMMRSEGPIWSFLSISAEIGPK